jgi:hypothetical protein
MAAAEVVQKLVRDRLIMNSAMNVCRGSADDFNSLGKNINIKIQKLCLMLGRKIV